MSQKVLYTLTRTLLLAGAISLSLTAKKISAEEHTIVHTFDYPVIQKLDNDTCIVEISDTKQNEAVVGAPLLPTRKAKIFIPPGETVVSVDVNMGTEVLIENSCRIQHATSPYPTNYSAPIPPEEPHRGIYKVNKKYPLTKHGKKKIQYMRGEQILELDLHPVFYNPVQNTLSYYPQLTVTVQTKPGKRPAGVLAPRNSRKDRKEILRQIDNKEDFRHLQAPKQTPPPDTREYVIITTSSMHDAFKELSDYRESKAGGGLTTHIENIEDIEMNYTGVDRAEKVRNFIKDMYTHYNTEYVVLGGDSDGPPTEQLIPTRGAYATLSGIIATHIPTDLYFACLDGTWNSDNDSLWGEKTDGVNGGDIDWTPEVYVGRIPADNAEEALRQIDKIILYETTAATNKTLMVGEHLWSRPITWSGDKLDWVYSAMRGMDEERLYDRDHALNNWRTSDLLAEINSNTYTWLNHLGHGSVIGNMKLTPGDLAAMNNSEPFFLYSQACFSGSIDGRFSFYSNDYFPQDAILEEMLNSSNSGAFAIIGNSRYGWFSPGPYAQGASNLAHKEFVDQVLTGKRLGEANQLSKINLNLNSELYRWIAFETNLLGCPFTDIMKPTDSDGDLVPDKEDHCSNTETDEVVNIHGCSMSQLCPCEGPQNSFDLWMSHGRYVSCITKVVKDFVEAGLLDEEAKGAVVSEAARSNCGDKH
ncbi:MAG: hypothetical protein D3908_01370 [Candidatus Electrothrix sp. AUS4]|nr:hypothetical protein [Candidatus Electrothrix sp. AUS4]